MKIAVIAWRSVSAVMRQFTYELAIAAFHNILSVSSPFSIINAIFFFFFFFLMFRWTTRAFRKRR